MQKNKIILDEDKTRLEREIQVLKILRHPNLVHLYSVIEKDLNERVIPFCLNKYNINECLKKFSYLNNINNGKNDDEVKL